MRSIVSSGAIRSCSSFSASTPQRPVAAVDEEAGAVDRVDHVLAHRLAGGARDARARVSEDSAPATTSSSAITGGGLKKCIPTTRSGWVESGGDRRHEQRRGVRRQHAVRGDDAGSSCANSSRLSSSDSGAASITSSQRASSSRLATRSSRSSAAFASSSVQPAPGRALRELAADRVRCRARAPPGSGSCSSVVAPA